MYKIFKDTEPSPGFYVWKVDENGKKVERKNDTPYKTRSEASPYLRKLYQVENEPAKASTEPDMTSSTNLVVGSVHFEADTDNPRFLRFKDAVLARAETNANRDNIDSDGVHELAATIAGTHIDLDHDVSKTIGVYTEGRVGDDNELRVGGIIWLDSCDALGIDPEDIKRGKHKMSVEAEAETATCSICHAVHTDALSYCRHLKAKMRSGAERLLRGLKAVGGALTLNPAGSGTGFDSASTILFMASHQFEEEQNMADENELEAIDKREDVSPADKKRAESEYGDVEYADEKNKKYPLSSLEKAQAAERYFGMPKNREEYSPEEQKAIQGKIDRALKKFGGTPSEKNKEEAMTDEETKETPEEEKKESPAKEKDEKDKGEEVDMKAEYATMKKNMDDMTAAMETLKTENATLKAEKADFEAKLNTATAALEDAKVTIKAHRTAELKSKLVGSVMDEEKFNANVDKYLTWDAEAIELIAANRKPETKADGKLNMAATDQNDTVTFKLYRS